MRCTTSAWLASRGTLVSNSVSIVGASLGSPSRKSNQPGVAACVVSQCKRPLRGWSTLSFLLAPRLVCAGPRARHCRLCVLGSRLLRALTRNPVEHIASPRQRTQGIRSSAPYGALLAHLTLPRLACQGQGAGATVQEISYHKATAGHPQ